MHILYRKYILLSAVSFIAQLSVLNGQNLDSLLMARMEKTTEYTSATFKATRILNGHSIERTNEGQLDFRISHRFGTFNSGAYEFFGLDQATMRLGFDYGINHWLMAGFERSTFEKTWDIYLKSKFMDQSTGPFMLVGYAAASANTLRNVLPADRENIGNRMSYVVQAIIGRSFGRLSFQLAPIMIHSVYELQANQEQNYYSLGMAGSITLSKRLQFTAEYYLGLSSHNFTMTDPLSFGLNLDTGGHLFQLVVGNTQGLLDKALIANTSGTWRSGDIYFGFNLVRVFYIRS